MQIQDYLTPSTRKMEFFKFNNGKQQENAQQPSEFQGINPNFVSIECTTLKLGDCPEKCPSIKASSKNISKGCSRRRKLWLIDHAPYIRLLRRNARP